MNDSTTTFITIDRPKTGLAFTYPGVIEPSPKGRYKVNIRGLVDAYAYETYLRIINEEYIQDVHWMEGQYNYKLSRISYRYKDKPLKVMRLEKIIQERVNEFTEYYKERKKNKIAHFKEVYSDALHIASGKNVIYMPDIIKK